MTIIRENLSFLFGQPVAEDKTIGIRSLYLFVDPSTRVYIDATWSFWEQFLLMHEEQLFAQVSDEGEDQGTSFFYNICKSETGRDFISRRWPSFWEPLVRRHAAMLFASVTGPSKEDNGKTPFDHLLITSDGIAFLKERCDVFCEMSGLSIHVINKSSELWRQP